ncbi:MAG TPA: hypothetical protein VLD63_06045 [Anaerolineales bacterium]|nr:hypothetical protein [Anaerolineales bacterium]
MLAQILVSVFLALHGLVHLLYFAQSYKIFELKPHMTWPVGSWALTRALGESGTRAFTSAFCVLVAVGLLLGAVGLLAGQAWWRPSVAASAAVSALLFLLTWNGQLQNIDGQGGIGILLDILVLVTILVFRWP